MDKKKLLKERDSTTSKETKILVLTYSQSPPKFIKVVCKQWNILSINKWFFSFRVFFHNIHES